MSYDPLDMSYDSLDKLQILGTAKGVGVPSTRQSKRGNGMVGTSHGGRAARIDDDDRSIEAQKAAMTMSMEKSNKNEQLYKLLLSSTTPPLVLEEHTASITRLRIPAKTHLLLSASSDGTIRIWGPDSDRSRAVLDANSFRTDQNSSYYFDSRPERRITLGVNADSNEAIASGGGGGVGNVKIVNMWASEGCDMIWAACSDASLRVWSGGEGRPLRLVKGHEEMITSMEGIDCSSSNSNSSSSGSGSISSSSSTIASGLVSSSQAAFLNQAIGITASSSSSSSSSGVNNSNCLVATGSADRTVRIWDVRSKKSQVFLFRGHGDTVLALRWGEGGRSLISASKDKTIRIWDTRAGR